MSSGLPDTKSSLLTPAHNPSPSWLQPLCVTASHGRLPWPASRLSPHTHGARPTPPFQRPAPAVPALPCSRAPAPADVLTAQRPAWAAAPEVAPLVTICHIPSLTDHQQRPRVNLCMYVLGSCGCGNQSPHTCRLETTERYPPTVTQAGSLKSASPGQNQGVSQRPAVACGCDTPASRPASSLSSVFSSPSLHMCVKTSLCFPLRRIHVIALEACSDHQGSSPIQRPFP